MNYYGTPGPGTTVRKTFVEVLASTELQAKMPGGVLLAKGNGYLVKGTVLGKYTSGPNIDKYGPYDPAATDGRETARCILDNDHDTTDDDCDASAWIAGIFDTAKLTGIDAAAQQALKLCYFV